MILFCMLVVLFGYVWGDKKEIVSHLPSGGMHTFCQACKVIISTLNLLTDWSLDCYEGDQ